MVQRTPVRVKLGVHCRQQMQVHPPTRRGRRDEPEMSRAVPPATVTIVTFRWSTERCWFRRTRLRVLCVSAVNALPSHVERDALCQWEVAGVVDRVGGTTHVGLPGVGARL